MGRIKPALPFSFAEFIPAFVYAALLLRSHAAIFLQRPSL